MYLLTTTAIAAFHKLLTHIIIIKFKEQWISLAGRAVINLAFLTFNVNIRYIKRSRVRITSDVYRREKERERVFITDENYDRIHHRQKTSPDIELASARFGGRTNCKWTPPVTFVFDICSGNNDTSFVSMNYSDVNGLIFQKSSQRKKRAVEGLWQKWDRLHIFSCRTHHHRAFLLGDINLESWKLVEKATGSIFLLLARCSEFVSSMRIFWSILVLHPWSVCNLICDGYSNCLLGTFNGSLAIPFCQL